MTFEDLFQQLSKLTPDERKNHDLTILEPNDDEFFKVDLQLKKVDDNNEDDPGGGILDDGHPYLKLVYIS